MEMKLLRRILERPAHTIAAAIILFAIAAIVGLLTGHS